MLLWMRSVQLFVVVLAALIGSGLARSANEVRVQAVRLWIYFLLVPFFDSE